MTTRREALLALHEELTGKARDIMRAKNHDYTSNSDDPYANFRGAEFVNVTPVKGILMRMLDKLKRVLSYDEQGKLEVAGEGLEDALVDLINYAVIVGGFVRDAARGNPWDELGEPEKEKAIMRAVDAMTGKSVMRHDDSLEEQPYVDPNQTDFPFFEPSESPIQYVDAQGKLLTCRHEDVIWFVDSNDYQLPECRTCGATKRWVDGDFGPWEEAEPSA